MELSGEYDYGGFTTSWTVSYSSLVSSEDMSRRMEEMEEERMRERRIRWMDEHVIRVRGDVSHVESMMAKRELECIWWAVLSWVGIVVTILCLGILVAWINVIEAMCLSRVVSIWSWGIVGVGIGILVLGVLVLVVAACIFGWQEAEEGWRYWRCRLLEMREMLEEELVVVRERREEEKRRMDTIKRIENSYNTGRFY